MPPTREQIEAAEAQIVEHSKRIEFLITDFSVELLANKMKNGGNRSAGFYWVRAAVGCLLP